jgi:hypothetical protein
MIIDWPLIVLLFCSSLPGVVIAMTRLVHFLLPNNTEELKKRASKLVIFQALFMVLAMSFAGSVLSPKTGLNDPLFDSLVQGQGILTPWLDNLFALLSYSVLCFIVFCFLYYGIVRSILDEQSLEAMTKLRKALKIDGCILYGGVVEEIIARWGLMNLVAFFAMLFAKQMSNTVVYTAILLSGLMYAIGQVPVYLAAGCRPSRRLVYSLVLLSLCQSLFFGFVFWKYGLIAAIIAHSLFHLYWAIYDRG